MTVSTKPVVWMPSGIHPDAFKLANELFDVITPEDPRAANWWVYADGSVVRTGGISVEEAEKAHRLKIVSRNGVGYETIPVKTCFERGIIVTRLPGINTHSVAELCVALTLAVLRRVVELDRRMRRGEVLPSIDWLSTSVDGKMLGLVGMGDIARSYAWRMSRAFNTPILVYSPTSSPLKWTDKDPSGRPPIPHTRVQSLEELLQRSDIVSLHCPATPQTCRMMGKRQFEMMKPTAVFINTARGALVDEDALTYALKNRVIYGAGLDVLCHEPATIERYSKLYELENIVLQPHAGAGSEEVQRESCIKAVRTVHSFLLEKDIGDSSEVKYL
ncbi:D-isomer specific 2-hydroxyacid dehydrogenase [Vararia minispora EC-137]|uniref:D-isomer specific 2-hydroxyacid dehydrogenase n=1 Tax=Vararia minispora EC-137 TaxID=1314806 RepID=A0ACB8QHY9_9AGAM|nr:D-isomer specific 2-hydroxyacid dehydrogenase [Vararia minispora EC-137]